MRHVRRRITGLAIFTISLAGCRSSITSFASSPAATRSNATSFFTAFRERFDSVARDPLFNTSRLKIARHAFIPSTIFADTSIWTERTDSSRAIYVHSTFTQGRYVYQATPPSHPDLSLGDERQSIRLTRLANNDFDWTTSVEHDVGHASPTEIAAAINQLFTGAEGQPTAIALAGETAAFPRAGAQLSRLIRLDSLVTDVRADGTTRVSLGASFTPDRLRAEFPAFAVYIDRYVMPSVYDVRITDRADHTFLRFTGSNGRLHISLTARNGSLVSEDGRTTLPDSFLIRTDFSAKYHAFRVGYANMETEVAIERGAHRRALALRFNKEPSWHFPFAIDKLIRKPLHRPFEDGGVTLTLGVRDDLGPETISFRDTHVVVRESAIMRWLGHLGATAFGDFTGKAEAEENRFLVLLLSALIDDVKALP